MNKKEGNSFKLLEKENRALKNLLNAAQLLNESLEIEDVLEKAMETAEKTLNAETSSIWELDEEKDELFFRMIRGEKAEKIKKKRLKIGQGIAGWVASTKKPLIVEDVTKDSRWNKYFDKESHFKTKSILTVPLTAKEKLIGVLQLLNKKDGENFTHSDEEMIMGLSSPISIALENARLYQKIKDIFIQTSLALATAIEKRDPYTGGHTKRVLDYSLKISEKMGLSKKENENLRIASILHDVGKIGIPDRILAKKRKLNKSEFEYIKKHSQFGAEILEKIRGLEDAVLGIKHHHEWYNGAGYPSGLKEEQIPILARIISVADAFDALTTERPYRKAFSKKVALNILKEYTRIQFCPNTVEIFLQVME